MKRHQMISLLSVLSAVSCDQAATVVEHEKALESAPIEEAAPEPIEIVGESGPEPDPNDLDHDGVPAAIDLDDLEETIGAVLPERECDGIDQDGDGRDACPVDRDADGVPTEHDCDDSDPNVNMLTVEIWCDGIDQNCNGVDDCDRDGDGWRDNDDPEPDIPATEPAVVHDEEP